MMKQVIAVSGKNGQLGWELERLSKNDNRFQFIFCDKDQLDITNAQHISDFFQTHKPSYFINTAAYTAVDNAETNQVDAYKTNAEAIGFIATKCKEYDTVFITFSTDYVFNGDGKEPYNEDDATDPVNYYGYTKDLGEKLALSNCEKAIIIRTSWVYSAHGNNFVKTMLRLMNERSDINVVNDQIGSPTSAKDLAEAVMKIITSSNRVYGIYHYSNDGIISWFDFAVEIKNSAGLPCNVHPIPTSQFPTPAKRPAYSVLGKQKIVENFNIKIKDWKQSLKVVIDELIPLK